MVRYSLLAALLCALAGNSAAFVPKPPSSNSRVVLNGFFDKAFANEKIDTPDRTASGLTGGPPKPSVEVIICGKKTQAIPGQRMRDLVTASRAPIKFDCGDGKCGTCESMVNGRKVRICKLAVPAKGPVKVEKIR